MKKMMDPSGLGEVGTTTPKSNSGLVTPKTPGGDNDSQGDKSSKSSISSMHLSFLRQFLIPKSVVELPKLGYCNVPKIH